MTKYTCKSTVAVFCIIAIICFTSCEKKETQDNSRNKKVKQVTYVVQDMQYLYNYIWDGDLLSRVEVTYSQADNPNENYPYMSFAFSYNNKRLSTMSMELGGEIMECTYTWVDDKECIENGSFMEEFPIRYFYNDDNKVSKMYFNGREGAYVVIPDWEGDNFVRVTSAGELAQSYRYDNGNNPFYGIQCGVLFNNMIAPMAMIWSANNMTEMISYYGSEETEEIETFKNTYDAEGYLISKVQTVGVSATTYYTYYE